MLTLYTISCDIESIAFSPSDECTRFKKNFIVTWIWCTKLCCGDALYLSVIVRYNVETYNKIQLYHYGNGYDELRYALLYDEKEEKSPTLCSIYMEIVCELSRTVEKRTNANYCVLCMHSSHVRVGFVVCASRE